jgi:hypothetical protein
MFKNLFLAIALFGSGFCAAGLVFSGYLAGGEAWADPYSCIRTGLKADGMTGNIPDPAFMILYKTPHCLKAAGYKVAGARVLGSEVSVMYQK